MARGATSFHTQRPPKSLLNSSCLPRYLVVTGSQSPRELVDTKREFEIAEKLSNNCVVLAERTHLFKSTQRLLIEGAR